MCYENAIATQLMATHCCFCRKPLRDAESVQRGIGPICKGKYAVGEITEESLKAGLGVVAVHETTLGSDLVEKIITLRHSGGKDSGRQIANLVIYHASARRAESAFVLRCADVLEAVGYGVAAERLRTNYARIQIILNDGRLDIYTPYSTGYNEACRDFPSKRSVYDETRTNRAGGKKFKCWSIQKDDLDIMLPLLGWFFPGEAAVVQGTITVLQRPDRIDTIQVECRKRKADRAAARTSSYQAPTNAVVTLKLNVDYPGYIDVYAPFHVPFAEDLKLIPRRKAVWNRGAKADGSDKFRCWSVPMEQRGRVYQVVADHFGAVAVDDQTV